MYAQALPRNLAKRARTNESIHGIRIRKDKLNACMRNLKGPKGIIYT